MDNKFKKPIYIINDAYKLYQNIYSAKQQVENIIENHVNQFQVDNFKLGYEIENKLSYLVTSSKKNKPSSYPILIKQTLLKSPEKY